MIFITLDMLIKNLNGGVNSVNPLYLMIDKIDGFAEGKNGNKYLNIADTSRNGEILKNIIKYLQ